METNLQISQGGDDGNWAFGRSEFVSNGSGVSLGDSGVLSYRTFFCFRDVDIPRSHAITSAVIRLTSTYNWVDEVYRYIYGNAVDNASPPTSAAEGDALGLTAAGVEWLQAGWSENVAYVSPDISAIIQEIIHRPGWSEGNSIQILIYEHPFLFPTGFHSAYAYDWSPIKSAQLLITSKWAGKINGITPSKINGIPVENIRRVNGI